MCLRKCMPHPGKCSQRPAELIIGPGARVTGSSEAPGAGAGVHW